MRNLEEHRAWGSPCCRGHSSASFSSSSSPVLLAVPARRCCISQDSRGQKQSSRFPRDEPTSHWGSPQHMRCRTRPTLARGCTARSGLGPASPQSSLAPLTCIPRGLGSLGCRMRPAVLVQPPGDSSGGSSEAGSRGTGAALCRRSPA